MTELSEPILVVGAGGAGSKLASSVKDILNADCLQISNDESDFNSGCDHIRVSTKGVLNPSARLIAGCAMDKVDEITERISRYSSVVIMANLAGRSGAAISPIISRLTKKEGKNVITFAIMPFRFEKDRIFNSGIALKRLRSYSDGVIVIDNNAILDNNPDLTTVKCYEITNSVLVHVVNFMKTTSLHEGTNLVATSKDALDLETSLRDSLKMLYTNVPASGITHSVLYVLGGDRIPVGMLDAITRMTSGAFDGKSSVDYVAESSAQSKVVLVSATQGETRFDLYDPLGMIPPEHTLDWEEPESHIDGEFGLRQLE